MNNSVANQLRFAINEFLTHKDFTPEGNKLFKQKQKQLISFSKEIQCVPVCIEILSSEQDQRINYFASMLLKDKLKYDFNQLDTTAVEQTHTMLVNLLKNINNPSKILLTNLILCLVYLYIHSIQKIGTVMTFFQMTFAQISTNQQQQIHNINNKNQLLYFFKFLELLPEQVKNTKLVIDEECRQKAQMLIRSQQTQIMQQMHIIFNNFSTSQNKLSFIEQEILLHAFSGWLEINPQNQEIMWSLHHHSLMNLAVDNLDDQLIFQAAARCITITIEIMELPQNNKQLFMFLSEKLLGSFHKFDQLLKQCNFQIVQQYVQVLCEYGSVSANFLVEQYNQSVQNFLHHMIMYLQKTEIEAFASMVDFWESFISAIKHKSQKSPLSKDTATSVIGRLFVTLFQRIRYTASDLEQLNEISERNLVQLHQSAEDIQTYREQGGYLFYAIGNYLGKQNFVQQIVRSIKHLDRSNHGEFWTTTQAMISSLKDVVDQYPEPSQQICHLVMLYEELDPSYIMLKRSFCRTFDELFKMKKKNQQFILKMLGYIVNMLSIPLLSDRAEKTFNHCCKQNSEIVGKHIETVYNLINVFPDRAGLLEGVAHVIKSSPNIATNVIPNLLNTQINKLDQGISSNESSKSRKKFLLNTFQNIFSLLKCIPDKNIQEQHVFILQSLLQRIWPTLAQIISNPFKKQSDQDKVVEQCIKLLKIILRAIPDKFLNVLQQISATIVNTYKKYPLSSFVYFYELVLTQYRNYPQEELSKFLLNFFIQITDTTFKHVQQYGGIGILSILADDFLGLAKRIVTYNKLDLLLQSNKINDIFKFAVLGLESEHSRIASSSSQFFQIVLMIYWTPYSRKCYQSENIGQIVEYNPKSIDLYQQLKEYILPMIPKMISDLFKCLSKVPIQSARDNILDCLTAIALAFPDQSEQLWSQPLRQIEVDILTDSQKVKLIKNLLQLGTNDSGQFNNNQMKFSKLMYLVSKRYIYRANRQRLSSFK